MKTYRETIKSEGIITLSNSFAGYDNIPNYDRCSLIADIYGKNVDKVIADVELARDSKEVMKIVSLGA